MNVRIIHYRARSLHGDIPRGRALVSDGTTIAIVPNCNESPRWLLFAEATLRSLGPMPVEHQRAIVATIYTENRRHKLYSPEEIREIIERAISAEVSARLTGRPCRLNVPLRYQASYS